MARAYAARLGCIAFVFGLMRHVLNGAHIDQAIASSLGFLLVFAVLGYVIGATAEGLIRQSVETNYRNSVEKYRQRSEKTAVEQN